MGAKRTIAPRKNTSRPHDEFKRQSQERQPLRRHRARRGTDRAYPHCRWAPEGEVEVFGKSARSEGKKAELKKKAAPKKKAAAADDAG